MRRLAAVLVLVVPACSSTPPRQFQIEALNTKEENVPCVVFVNDAIAAGADGNPIVTPATVSVDFTVGGHPGGGVKIAARAVKLGADGIVLAEALRSVRASPYLEDSRTVYSADPPKQLFILRPNKSYEE